MGSKLFWMEEKPPSFSSETSPRKMSVSGWVAGEVSLGDVRP